MMKGELRSIALAALAFGPGCSDSVGHVEQEVIISLFKPQGRDITDVVVTARQGSTERSVNLGAKSFLDCESNRVRIVPRANDDGTFPDLTINAQANHGTLRAAPNTVTFPRTSLDLIAIVLQGDTTAGAGDAGAGALEPSGWCTPAASTDAGVADLLRADAGSGHDGAPGTRKTGAACSTDTECEGGLCLSFFKRDSLNIELPDKYCSRDCSDDRQCPEGASCEMQTSAAGGDLGWRCLQSCGSTNPCDRSPYTCKGGGICLP